MCGIAGLLSGPHGAADADAAARACAHMTCAVAHRGPDAEGVWREPGGRLVLGHRRLAIVDLSETGRQPMTSASGRYTIVFNGEVYNHAALRAELAGGGVQLRGTSDTEVLLEIIARRGVAATMPRLAGMFAFALWDARDEVLHLARDPMGEKPLYYGRVGGAFVFGSELKALAAAPGWTGQIDRDALAAYLRANYVPAPQTIFRNVWKLPAGATLAVRPRDVRAGVHPAPERFFRLEGIARRAPSGVRSDAEYEEALVELLDAIVREQVVADVPVGALLSGGVDSSIVVALMQRVASRPVRTFTVGFDHPGFDESAAARAVAAHLGTDHHEVRVTGADTLREIPRLATIYDEPFGDSSQLPTALVMRAARGQVTVCLTGDGGDEVFCGYNRHVKLDRLWRSASRVPRGLRRAGASVLGAVSARRGGFGDPSRPGGVSGEQLEKLQAVLGATDFEDAYVRLASLETHPARLVPGAREPERLLLRRDRWPAASTALDRTLLVEALTSLPDNMLVKVDRAAMAVGLETRAPLLDRRVVEFAWSLPTDVLLRAGRGKWVVRRALDRFVPRPLIDRPKTGFAPPLREWLLGPLREWALHLIDPSRLRAEGWLDTDRVRELWRRFEAGTTHRSEHLWGILMFQAWLDAQRAGAEHAR